jgi:hypothetical protein
MSRRRRNRLGVSGAPTILLPNRDLFSEDSQVAFTQSAALRFKISDVLRVREFAPLRDLIDYVKQLSGLGDVDLDLKWSGIQMDERISSLFGLSCRNIVVSERLRATSQNCCEQEQDWLHGGPFNILDLLPRR